MKRKWCRDRMAMDFYETCWQVAFSRRRWRSSSDCSGCWEEIGEVGGFWSRVIKSDRPVGDETCLTIRMDGRASSYGWCCSCCSWTPGCSVVISAAVSSWTTGWSVVVSVDGSSRRLRGSACCVGKIFLTAVRGQLDGLRSSSRFYPVLDQLITIVWWQIVMLWGKD